MVTAAQFLEMVEDTVRAWRAGQRSSDAARIEIASFVCLEYELAPLAAQLRTDDRRIRVEREARLLRENPSAWAAQVREALPGVPTRAPEIKR